MPKLTLISHDLCPYVQRAVIALTEKGVAFDRIYIDLADKPDWFLAISPLGKVPLLKVGDDVIFESAVILEYLEETQPHPLHPADPLARARHRAMIEFGSAILSDIWGLEIAPTHDVACAQDRGAAAEVRAARAGAGRRPLVRGRKIRAGRRRVRAGVPLFRPVRSHSRSRDFRAHAEGRGLAVGACRAPLDPRRGGRGLCRTAGTLRGEAERLSRRAADEARGLMEPRRARRARLSRRDRARRADAYAGAELPHPFRGKSDIHSHRQWLWIPGSRAKARAPE